jgi:hypothetical protein
MRIEAKGMNWSVVKLADGTTKTYWYAWRGGPRLEGEYGSPEFIASYNRAIATKVATPEGRLQALIDGYQKTQDFLSLLSAHAPTTSNTLARLNRSSATCRPRRSPIRASGASCSIGATNWH